jgi:hypothetical protein
MDNQKTTSKRGPADKSESEEIMKRITKKTVSLAFAIAATTSMGAAQGPAIATPINNWSFMNHSSTIAEGAMRGQASVMSAAGELAYLDSLASINYQEAYRRAIDNSVAYTKAYYEKRELRAEFHEKYSRKPFVGEARKKVVEFYQPKKLTADQFNAQTGQLTWPHILRQSQYAPIKVEIDTLFETRNFENSGNGSVTQLKLSQLIRSLAALLRENIDSMSAEQYINAQEYLRSVDAESKNAVLPKVADQPNAPVTVPINATVPTPTVPNGGAPGTAVSNDGVKG